MSNLVYYIGLIACLTKLRNVLDFLWFYFLRPTNRWQQYLQGPSPYAVVTGASDGIGKSTAKELYDKGFNLILHGRNEKKLKDVVAEIQSANSKRTGQVQDVKYFLEDASKAGTDFEGIAKRFEGLNITIFVNNVGGSTVRPERFNERTEEEIMGEIRVNSLFSLLLTKAFLPSLRATARARPTIVVFIGSFSDETPMARIVVYSATKHFDRRVALGLHADERFDTPDDKAISFMYVGLATVTTQLTREPPNFGRPSSELFAEKLVGIFGCGRQVVIPYIGHYLARLVFTNLPEFLLAKALDKAAHEHVEKTIRESKSQS